MSGHTKGAQCGSSGTQGALERLLDDVVVARAAAVKKEARARLLGDRAGVGATVVKTE